MIMPEIGRNASTVFNRVLATEHFWDGHAKSLEDQPRSPLENPFEMNSSVEQATASIAAIDGYRIQFEAIFGEVSFNNICRALASFERVIVTSASPWDGYRLRASPELSAEPSERTGESKSLLELIRQQPLSAGAIRGADLFFGDRAKCGYCHVGANLTDEQYHNLGVGLNSSDPGRMKVTKDPGDRGAFKTPSLRNVAKTAPYMHNGQFGTLSEVIEFLDQGCEANDNLSSLIEPLRLTSEEKADLIEFLQSLTSPLPPVQTGRLPE